MTCFVCETCGTQFEDAKAPPAHCPICCDDRQYVGWGGQRWTTVDDLAARYSVRIEDDGGLLGVGTAPAFAIDQRALILPTKGHRIMWESTSLVTPDAVAKVTRAGKIDLIAISHPHFYSSMVEWSEALGRIPILLHQADKEWVARPSPHIAFWSGETHVISSGVRLIRCGGHFPGSTALHWQDERRPKGALFPGDALQVTADRRHVTFMYSYPNAIPMHPDAVRKMRRAIARLEFEDVFGFTWKRNILGGGQGAVARSFDRYLSAIGQPAFSEVA